MILMMDIARLGGLTIPQEKEKAANEIKLTNWFQIIVQLSRDRNFLNFPFDDRRFGAILKH